MPALASEMIMKSLRKVWRKTTSCCVYKSLQERKIDAEINLTITGWEETFQINRVMMSRATWQLIIMITSGLSQKVAYLLAHNRWEACIFHCWGLWNWSFGSSINMMNCSLCRHWTPHKDKMSKWAAKSWGCSYFTTVPPVIDLHPAEPLQETKYTAYNLVIKQCMRLSACPSIPTQAFPGADRSLNYQALCNMVQSMSLKWWDNKVRQGVATAGREMF